MSRSEIQTQASSNDSIHFRCVHMYNDNNDRMDNTVLARSWSTVNLNIRPRPPISLLILNASCTHKLRVIQQNRTALTVKNNNHDSCLIILFASQFKRRTICYLFAVHHRLLFSNLLIVGILPSL